MIEVGGRELISLDGAVIYAKTNSEGEVNLEPDFTEQDNWNIKWDGYTLTLRDANIVSQEAFGIVGRFIDYKIVLEGENLVSAGNKTELLPYFYNAIGSYFSSGILAYAGENQCSLVICAGENGGSLKAMGGDVYCPEDNSAFSCGITVIGKKGPSLTIESGAEIEALGGAAFNQYGNYGKS